MGASFRTPEQVLALNGCDRLTVSPQLLAQLQQRDTPVAVQLQHAGEAQEKPAAIGEAEFYWAHNQDAMAVEKLAEGIRLFAVDQNNWKRCSLNIFDRREAFAKLPLAGKITR